MGRTGDLAAPVLQGLGWGCGPRGWRKMWGVGAVCGWRESEASPMRLQPWPLDLP